jgi:hypothetical protein
MVLDGVVLDGVVLNSVVLVVFVVLEGVMETNNTVKQVVKQVVKRVVKQVVKQTGWVVKMGLARQWGLALWRSPAPQAPLWGKPRWRLLAPALCTSLVTLVQADLPAQAMPEWLERSDSVGHWVVIPQPDRQRPNPAIAPASTRPVLLAQAAPNTPATEQPPAVAMPALAVTVNEIEVLSVGAEPRSPVRYQLQVGDRHDATLSMNTTVSTRVGDRLVPTPTIPALEFDLHTLIQDSPNPELFRYTLTYDEARAINAPAVDSELLAIFEPMLDTLQGLGVRVMMDAIGTVESMQVMLPDDADPVMRSVLEQLPQSMGQLSFPLPTEALGVGAQWRATSQVTMGPLAMEQTVTYTLVAREGDRLTLAAELSQSLLPDQGGEIAAGLQSINTTGTGNIELMLDRPLPTQAQLRLMSIAEIQPPTPDMGPFRTETNLEMQVTTR